MPEQLRGNLDAENHGHAAIQLRQRDAVVHEWLNGPHAGDVGRANFLHERAEYAGFAVGHVEVRAADGRGGILGGGFQTLV